MEFMEPYTTERNLMLKLKPVCAEEGVATCVVLHAVVPGPGAVQVPVLGHRGRGAWGEEDINIDSRLRLGRG